MGHRKDADDKDYIIGEKDIWIKELQGKLD